MPKDGRRWLSVARLIISQQRAGRPPARSERWRCQPPGDRRLAGQPSAQMRMRQHACRRRSGTGHRALRRRNRLGICIPGPTWPRLHSPSVARTIPLGPCAAGCCARWPGWTSPSGWRRSTIPATRAELLLLSPVLPGAVPGARRGQGLGHAGDRRVPERDQARGRPAAGRSARPARIAGRSAARCIRASPTCARRCR